MNQPLLFIHGLFFDARAWSGWVSFFEGRGYRVRAPEWPGNRATVALEMVVEHFARIAGEEELAPILIGHSVGGLVVQLLLAAGHGEAGVCLAPVPPAALLRGAPGRFREWAERGAEASAETGVAGVGCSRHGWEPGREELLRELAGGGQDRAEVLKFLEQGLVPGLGRVAADLLGPAGVVDLERPHAPLLIVGAGEDRVVPDAVCEANARAYTDPGSVADYRLFLGRGHLLPFEPGWEEVATQVDAWLAAHAGRELAGRW